jgi:hypothetical protein
MWLSFSFTTAAMDSHHSRRSGGELGPLLATLAASAAAELEKMQSNLRTYKSQLSARHVREV